MPARQFLPRPKYKYDIDMPGRECLQSLMEGDFLFVCGSSFLFSYFFDMMMHIKKGNSVCNTKGQFIG